MGELVGLVRKGNFRSIFVAPTNNTMIQLFRYAFVGGAASIVDWGILYILSVLGMYYLLSAIFGFFGGLATNFMLSKLFVFSKEKVKVSIRGEFLSYALIGVIGLGLTLIFMYIMTELIGIYFMISKIIATVLVLIWNFGARKMFLYKE